MMMDGGLTDHEGATASKLTLTIELDGKEIDVSGRWSGAPLPADQTGPAMMSAAIAALTIGTVRFLGFRVHADLDEPEFVTTD
jgi:hypothetical protein